MKTRIRCTSFLKQMTGHNDACHYVFEFERELKFGPVTSGMQGGLTLFSDEPEQFTVGDYYDLTISIPTKETK